jgi:hypothetical protein
MASNDASPPVQYVSHPIQKENTMSITSCASRHSFPSRHGGFHPVNYSAHKDYRFYEPYERSSMYPPPGGCDSTGSSSWSPYSQRQQQPPYARPWQRPSSTHSAYTTCPRPYTICEKLSLLPEDFIPPHHQFSSPFPSPAKVTPSYPTKPNASSEPCDSSKCIWELQDTDIVCGRGAPANFQHGNQVFRELVASYQTVYLCSKRGEKPKIAMELLELIRSRGGRFVRRVKTTHHGRFGWEIIEEKRAYQKVCQALRDGAPELRRRMLASSKVKEGE